MGYIEDSQLPDEEIIVEVKHHIAAFAFPVLLVAAGSFLMAGDFFYFGLIMLMAGIWKSGKIAVAFIADEMALTNKRVIGKTGLLRRDSIELRNESVSGLSVNQSILGRILGYGTVGVDGEGDDDIGLSYVKDPQNMRNTVQEYLADAA